MATKKRAGLGRGISSLIPTATERKERPVDVFFGSQSGAGESAKGASTTADEAVAPATNDAGTGSTSATAEKASTSTTSPRTTRGSSTTAKSSGAATRQTGTTGRATSAGKTAGKSPAKTTRTTSATPKADSKAKTGTGASGSTKRGTAETDIAPQSDSSKTIDVPTVAAPATATIERTDEPVTEPELVPIPGASLRQVDPVQVVPNAWQPRHEFDEEALNELVHSVREFGLLQPIVVRPIPEDHPLSGEAQYELIMGERRLRASKAAGLATIPAIVKETPDDVMLRDALLENLHRSQLNPLEEASAYQQLLDDFGITQEELAQRIGRSRPQVSNTLRLLKLPMEVQRRVAAGVLSAGHARAVLSVGEPTGMAQLADKIINEDLSVRAAEAAAAKVGARSTQGTGESRSPSGGGLTGYLDEVGEKLGDRLNTRVKVTLRRTKGQIVVDFASVADLNRILAELGEGTEPTA